MNPWKIVALQARRQLTWLAVALALIILLAATSHFFRDSLRRSVAQDEGMLSAQNAILAVKKSDLDNIQTHIKEFRSLKENGLVGNGDREGWVEQLVASRAALHLPNTLNYALNPARPISGDDAELTADPETTVKLPRAHDLEFELGEIHEDELLQLLQHVQARVHGRFRVQSCTLTSPTHQGLFVKCTLRFFTLPETAPAA